MRDHHNDEPTAADLAAIEAQEPLIDAELTWLDAEIAMIEASDRGSPGELVWRRLRRAEQAVIRETLIYVAQRTRKPGPRRAA